MHFDIPSKYESQIQQYAQSQHISADEALGRIVQVGLAHVMSTVSPHDVIGAFSDPEDADVMDNAIDLAMLDRERRNA